MKTVTLAILAAASTQMIVSIPAAAQSSSNAMSISSSALTALSLLEQASNPLLVQALYEHPERLVSHVAATGAVGVNGEWENGKNDKWFIEEQRYCADLIQAGVILKNPLLVSQGLKIMEWGFKHQGADGSFPGTGDPFHSTSFFVEATARSLLLMQESGDMTYKPVIDSYLPKLELAARWLTQPNIASEGQKRNLPYTHRRWLLAAALGETAVMTGDKSLAAAAEGYARDGLSLQLPDGINPEKGGYDSSYQAVGVLFAERYYDICGNAALRTNVGSMITAALRWEASRVDPNGEISVQDSSRVGHEAARSGKIKGVDYKVVLQAFVLGSKVTGDAQFEEPAKRIALGRHWVSQ